MVSSQSSTANRCPRKSVEICLGHRSALEIAREACSSFISSGSARNCKLPDHAPGKKEIEETLIGIESASPNLILTRPVHVLFCDGAHCRTTDAYISHSCRSELSNGALRRIDIAKSYSVLISSPPFAFTQIAAREASFFELLHLGFEICGTYQTLRTSVRPAYQVQPLTSTYALRDFVMRNPSINGVKKVRKALSYIVDGSASPRETKLALLLGLPMLYGGYGLGMPRMNFRVEIDAGAKGLSGRAYLLCDLCWPEAKLDVEYQSREMHTGEMSRISDSRRMNALDSMGWKTVGITNNELESIYAMDEIAETIRKCIGKRCRSSVSDYLGRKLNLRRKLGLP